MKNEKYLFSSIYKTLPALLILFIFYTAAIPEALYAFTIGSPVLKIELANQDDFDKKFRQARDLIDDEQWAKAAEEFGEIVNRYPDNKSVDVALYWLAFCHKKQKNFKEADAALDRLIEKFPASSWASDARVMKLEIAASLGKIHPLPASSAATTSALVSELTAEARSLKMNAGNLSQEFKSYQEFSKIFPASGAPPIPLDREDEIKIAAFQSLLAADPKRAVETLGELFKSDSKARDVFKQEALRVLRRPRIPRAPSVSRTASSPLNQNSGFSTDSKKIDKQFIPLLRETLLKGFQTERSIKIRKEIIYVLSAIGEDQTADELVRLYAAENDREIKKAIIDAFGNAAASGFTIAYNYDLGAASGVVSKTVGKTFKRGFDKLLEIIRAEKDTEMRRLAFSTLRGFDGSAAQPGMIETFAQMYDAETDEQFKVSIIHSLAESKQNQAEMKLLDIARKDKSDKLRVEAIRSLQDSQNPEVLKFLENLIK